MTPQRLRERVRLLVEQAESGNPTDAGIALEQLDQALTVVCDELDRTVPGTHETVMVRQHRVCRDLGQALGMEVPA